MHTRNPPTVVCIAGFGDNGSMYLPLASTELADRVSILPLNLPGFGAPAGPGETTLASLAEVVDAAVRAANTHVVLAHSVASIVTSIAAGKEGSPIRTIFSLEGNLTLEDTYYSGMAADYSDAREFHTAFLRRLDSLAADSPEIARYRRIVATADPTALWQLGCDARRFSEQNVPGDILVASSDVVYLYNPANVPKTSLTWLEKHDLHRVRLEGASHWPTIDQPDQVARVVLTHLQETGPSVERPG